MAKNTDDKKRKAQEVEAEDDQDYYEDEEEYNEEEGQEGEEEEYNEEDADEMKTKAEKREEKMTKKSKFDNNAQMVYDAKVLWEKLKLVSLSKSERQPLVDRLFKMVEGKMTQIVKKHDASRIIQTLLKYGNEKQRDTIYNELKSDVVAMAPHVYGRFLVVKLLKYCSKEQRNEILKAFYGSIVKLTRNREAGHVIEYMYAEIANAVQRGAILEEFYSEEYRLFKSDKARTLNDIITASPHKKEAIITELGKKLTKALSNKGELLVTYTFIQKLVIQYFEHATPENCSDMAETLSEITLPMVHTKDGAVITYYTISYGSAKTRKSIIKGMKDYFCKVALEQHGHLALLRLLDVTDDTMLLNKSVLAELITQLPDLAVSQYGHLWILHLLVPYSSQVFSEHTINRLKPVIKSTQDIEHKVSKKDHDTRRKELMEFMAPKLIDLCSNHLQQLCCSPFGVKVLTYTLKECQGNKIILMNRLIDLLTTSIDEEESIVGGNNTSNIQLLLKNDYIKTTDLPKSMFEKLKDRLVDLSLQDENMAFIVRDLIKYALSENALQKEAIKIIDKNQKKLNQGNVGCKSMVKVLLNQNTTKDTKKK
ncbi:Pumilio RNA-binding region-containing protein [Cavenderia fasciculata]|uniref:Pumilio RNA-binding region-containing protein n=1 Tax=Cavenderia fasciculata TaxID=261658 RepID=F4PMU4_CACFS|nr:Pumilio RNA-binding region-containing protein [Cavenderia fasciculata]EGG23688.1 Pumilio RNA-binding region-containing protein [Cavenderia fasciculata]|eukprot:XP_004361539.1 Pumilio RNA-binding region-containing protein [Cavenderia fasciculata]